MHLTTELTSLRGSSRRSGGMNCYATTGYLTKLGNALSTGQFLPNRPYLNRCRLCHGMLGRYVSGFFRACALYQLVRAHFLLGLSEWPFCEHHLTFAHSHSRGVAGRSQWVSVHSDSPTFHFLDPGDDLLYQSLSWSKGVIVADDQQVLHVVSPRWHNEWNNPRRQPPMLKLQMPIPHRVN